MKLQGILAAGLIFSGAAMAEKMDPAELLSRIHTTNMQEIEVGKLAVEKGTSDRVREFGERLVKDHTKADAEVQDLAKQLNVTLREPVARSAAEKDSMKKHKELGSKLRAMSASRFDDEFLTAMAEGHAEAVRMLSEARTEVARVDTFVQRLLPTLREHEHIANRASERPVKEAR